ncbi:MAG: Asr1405/Asl0597 family protein [Prochloraceae cyanobacterium]
MSLTNPKAKISQVVEVNSAARWQVYQRLLELQISCQCLTNKPLQVQLHSTKEAIQLWSVVKHLTASRQELASWLDRCWHMETSKEDR